MGLLTRRRRRMICKRVIVSEIDGRVKSSSAQVQLNQRCSCLSFELCSCNRQQTELVQTRVVSEYCTD